jgi:hypothetical protein
MRFTDRELAALDPKASVGLAEMLSRLCGQPVKVGCSKGVPCNRCQSCMNWDILSVRLGSESFSLEQFNDLLLLCNQRPLGEAFFQFFFHPTAGRVNFDQIKQGIANFEGFALLRFGNIRFAYRRLYQLETKALDAEIGHWGRNSKEQEDAYGKRSPAVRLPAEIAGNDSWLLGYIAKGAADHDISTYHAMATILGRESESEVLGKLDEAQQKLYAKRKEDLGSTLSWKDIFADLSPIKTEVDELQKKLVKTRRDGWLNTSHYLAADFMDVYVATSMRERWEFEDVNRFVKELSSQPQLNKLKLRYFDPTQSHLDYRIDKGLIEGLMLKRAACTVYMIQETDTFGKDSELASTLAQGKPVIAYIPRVDPKALSRIALGRPLSYLQRRLPQLAAERKIDTGQLKIVYEFLGEISGFSPSYILASTEEERFISERSLSERKKELCGTLAVAESKLYDSRATTLQQIHPLAVQVHLDTGVANGLLVVRSVEDCAELLRGLLLNTCEFEIVRSKREGATLLVERISSCPFRVLTENETLTNSFWSWYLTGE